MIYETIYDQFAVIVAHTAAKLGYAVRYEWGHPLEISDILKSLSKMPTKAETKFPLVALFTDIQEIKGDSSAIQAEVKLHLIIAINTLSKYSSRERLEINFKPKLYPIYNQLLKSICQQGFYVEGVPGSLEHNYYDRFRYGKTGIYSNTGEIFQDKIDCVEIENLKLTVLKQYCKTNRNL